MISTCIQSFWKFAIKNYQFNSLMHAATDYMTEKVVQLLETYIIKQKLILHRLNYEDRKVSIFKWAAAIKSVLTGAKATRSLLIRLLVINVWLLLHVYISLAKYLQLRAK